MINRVIHNQNQYHNYNTLLMHNNHLFYKLLQALEMHASALAHILVWYNS